jgi:plastocyanin
MRFRQLLLISAFTLFATNAFAKDVYLSIAGTVSNFRTDARIFNPSTTKDITVKAYFLPVGLGDNSAATPVNVTVPKRTQKVLDDVVSTVFSVTGIGAIRLQCDDDFVATSRIYAQIGGATLGQFVQGLDAAMALKNGVLIQIKSSSAFRTNIGAANPNGTAAHVSWKLYDKNNALIGSAKSETFPPFGVLGPVNVTGYFGSGSADLSDAWVSFTSDQPIFAYISVLDNASTDPTYIPASNDSGSASPAPTTQNFTVVERSGSITITPDPAVLNVGDTAVFHITSTDFTHGFTITAPDASTVIADSSIAPGQPAVIKQFTVTKTGLHRYFCTISSCSAGHSSMNGTFSVGGDYTGKPGY